VKKLLNFVNKDSHDHTLDVYRNIFENTFDAILLIDNEFRYIDANPSACDLLGYSKTELMNKKIGDLTPERNIEMGEKTWMNFLNEGNQKGEYILLKKDRREINVEYHAVANIQSGIHIFIINDVTTKKSTENTLKNKENILQGIFESSPVGINLIQDRKFIWSNDMMSQITGYSLDEIIGNNTRFLYLSDEDYEKAGCYYNKNFASDNVKEIDTRWKRKDGKIIDIQKKMSLLDPNKPDKGYITSVMDITDQKRAEDLLKQSEEKYRELANSLPEIIFETDENGNLTFVNRNALSIMGYTKEDFEKGLNAMQLLIPEERDLGRDNIRKIFEGKKSSGFEYTALRKDGSTFPIIIHSSAIMHNNKPIGLRGIIFDISERKEAEKRIMESEETLRSILTAAPVGIKLVKDRQIIWCNNSMIEMTGYSLEELTNKNLGFLYPNEEEYNKVGHVLYDKWSNEEYREIETIWKKNSGELINCHIRISPIDPTYFNKGMIEVITDITESKKAQKQLDENLEYFAHLIDHIRNPLTIICGFAQVEIENEVTKRRFLKQVGAIEKILKQLDQGWMDTEDTKKFLKKYM